MEPEEYFDGLRAAWTGQVVICALGTNGDAWWDRTQDDATAFYMGAAMGFTSSFAIGMALTAPDQEFWLLDSDGGAAMNAGGLLTEASVQPGNLTHFIFNNRRYGCLGGQPLVNSERTDYGGLAKAAGIERVWTVEDTSALEDAIEGCRGLDKHGLVVANVPWPDREEAFEPVFALGYEGAEMKYRFGRGMESRLGRAVFDERGC